MTTAITLSASLRGLTTQPVRVEADLANGLPNFSLVGLPSTAVRESRDRVRAALLNSGFGFPDRRVTVNLAPADLPKDSGRFDLAIALAILAAADQDAADRASKLKRQQAQAFQAALHNWVLVGELSLSGEILPIHAAFAYGLSVLKNPAVFLLGPVANASDWAALRQNKRIVCVHSLKDAYAFFADRQTSDASERSNTWVDWGKDAARLGPEIAAEAANLREAARPDLLSEDLRWESVQGQSFAKMAAMVAAAGHHSLLLMGPPGVGKSMIAHRLAGLMPSLTFGL